MHAITLSIVALITLNLSIFGSCSSNSQNSWHARGSEHSLEAALDDARAINCSDEVFTDPETTSPGLKWNRAKAQELMEALVWDWGNGQHGDFNSFSEYVADVLSSNSAMVDSFQCNDDVSGDACTDYRPQSCDPDYGPAASLILTSFSVVNYYFKNMNDTLFHAEVDLNVGDITETFVTYLEKTDSAINVLSMFAEVLMPVGAGQMLSTTMRGAINAATAAARDIDKIAVKAKYYVDQANNYKMQAQMFGFEISESAESLLEKGKDLIAGAESFLQESNTFEDLKKNIVTQWGAASQDVMGRLFSGSMTGDKNINGASNYAGLLSMFANGAWSEKINATGSLDQATTTLYSHLIPLALFQDSLVRPTMFVRPYACDDKTHQKKDGKFTKWFGSDAWPPVEVSLGDHPGLCFLLVDANGGASSVSVPTGGSGPGTQQDTASPGIIPLPGMDHSTLTGGAAFGGLILEDFVESLYTGWIANGRTNNVTAYRVNAQAPAGDPLNLWDNPIRSPGLYNPYFNVCGSDDINNYDWKAKTPPDMEIFSDNMIAAGPDQKDWGAADTKTGFPCDPDLKPLLDS